MFADVADKPGGQTVPARAAETGMWDGNETAVSAGLAGDA